MANYLFTDVVADPTLIQSFDPASDQIVFGSTVSAADVAVAVAGSAVSFTVGSDSITVPMDFTAITTSNVIFNDGSSLVVGTPLPRFGP